MIRKSSGYRNRKSKATGTKRRRVTIPKATQRMGFHFLPLEDNRKGRLMREGTIGEDGEYTLEAFSLEDEPINTEELFRDEEGRFTAEVMTFFGKNFGLYAVGTKNKKAGMLQAFGDTRTNPLKDVPNSTQGIFNFGTEIDQFGNPIYILSDGSETINWETGAKLKRNKDIWYKYSITIEDPDLGKSRDGIIKITDIVNIFYDKLKTQDTIGYLMTDEDGVVSLSTEPLPDSIELQGVFLSGSDVFEEIDPNNSGSRSSFVYSPIMDKDGNVIQPLSKLDVFRMRVNDNVLLPTEFFDKSPSAKILDIKDAVDDNVDKPTITFEYNLSIIEKLANIHQARGDKQFLADQKLPKHPAYIAHSTSDKVSDLTRLQWIDIVRRDLENEKKPIVLLSNDSGKLLTLVSDKDGEETKIGEGLEKRTPSKFFVTNRWDKDLVEQTTLRTRQQRLQEETTTRRDRTDTKRVVIYL